MALRRAVSMTERMSAYRLAAHSDRKQLVTLRKTTQGRSARSEPLLVGGMARLARKVNRKRRQPSIACCSLSPAVWVGMLRSSASSSASSL